ncbi:ABC transporter permease [Tsukamurella sp. 1534]|uniref:ABC transporter permease n=1 Tax=Tsukamurella sp. 1534 TaxID=1151061 RepID=UPI0003141B60|nr:FtsX-like permease family protein [Tsukamurella sp. 1534]
MASPMRRVALRNLMAHKGRLFLTVLSVLLGTSFIAGSMVFTGTLSKAFDGISDRIAVGVDARVAPENAQGQGGFGPSGPGVPLSVVDRVAAVPGVRVAQPAITGTIALRDGEGNVVSPSGAPQIGGAYLPPGENLDPAGLTITSGRAPSGPKEMVLNETAADRLDLRTGARTTVVTPHSPGPIEVTVVGVYTTSVDSGGYIGALFAKDEAQSLFGDGATTPNIDVAAADGTTPAQLREALAAALPDLDVKTGDEVRQEFEDTINQGLSFLNYFLVAFGLIGLLVGVFIIYNTFSMLVAQRLKELALLRAIGAGRGQVRNSVVLEALIVGILGSAAGLAVGVALAVGLQAAVKAAGAGFPDTGLVVSPSVIVTVMLVGTVVTVVSALIPAVRASKVPPVAAMRAQDGGSATSVLVRGAIGAGLFLGSLALLFVSTTESGSGAAILVGVAGFGLVLAVVIGGPALVAPVLGGVGRVLAVPFGPAGRLGRTNVMRNPQRTTATAFALVIGVALVGVIGTLGASMQKSIDAQVDSGIRSELVLQAPQFGMPPAALDAIKDVQGIGSRTTLYVAPARIGGEREQLLAVDGDVTSVFNLTRTSGDLALAGRGMLVDDRTARERGWEVGTPVPLGSGTGAETVTPTVTGIYKAQEGALSGPVVTAAEMNQLYPPARGSSSPVVTPQSVFIGAADGTDVDDLKQRLRDAVKPLLVVNVDDQQDLKDQAGQAITALMGVLYALLGLAVIIAILGIVNTLALSVVERRREIGMLRAIGMIRSQVRRSIYLESILIAVFGAVLGLFLGVLLGTSLVNALRDEGLGSVVVPWSTVIVMLVASAFVGVGAAILPAIRAARTPPLAAIAEG